MISEEEQPKMNCPQCDLEYEDFDGFGILHCEKCGYCVHASISGDVCDYCEKIIKE